jgi:hypothetical protein
LTLAGHERDIPLLAVEGALTANSAALLANEAQASMP